MIPNKPGDHVRVTNPKNCFFRKYGIVTCSNPQANNMPSDWLEVTLTNCCPPVWIPKTDMVINNRWKK